MTAWRAVIFDLDDTLVPEEGFVLGGFRAVARLVAERGGGAESTLFDEIVALYRVGIRGDTFDRWLREKPELSVSPGEVVECYRQHLPMLAPFPGIPELLHRLKRHCRLGLVSDGPLAVQERKWFASGLATLFDAAVFSDRLGRAAWKPSTTPFLAISEALEVESAACVYVGDNPLKDFRGARGAGMATICARHARGEYHTREPATPADAADWVTASVPALAALLLAGAEGAAGARLLDDGGHTPHL